MSCTFIWGLCHERVVESAHAGVLFLLLILGVTFNITVATHSWQERRGKHVSDKKPLRVKGKEVLLSTKLIPTEFFTKRQDNILHQTKQRKSNHINLFSLVSLFLSSKLKIMLRQYLKIMI